MHHRDRRRRLAHAVRRVAAGSEHAREPGRSRAPSLNPGYATEMLCARHRHDAADLRRHGLSVGFSRFERFWRDAPGRNGSGTARPRSSAISSGASCSARSAPEMQPLSRLLRPRSIAVVGGGTWCARGRRGLPAGWAMPGRSGRCIRRRPSWLAFAAFSNRSRRCPKRPTRPSSGSTGRQASMCWAPSSAMGAGGAVWLRVRLWAQESAIGRRGTGPPAGSRRQLVAAAGDNAHPRAELLRVREPSRRGPRSGRTSIGGERIERGVAIVTQSSNLALNLTMQAAACRWPMW